MQQFIRMDNGVAQRVSEGVGYRSTQTSGGRVRFSTDSSAIGISVAYPTLDQMPHMPLTGNSKGEPLMAEYLTGIDCSLFFLAYDGNAPSVEYLERTHFPFYEAYRQVKKDVPIVFMSIPSFENYPDTERRREVIRKSFIKARERGDENVYFIDGETLYGPKDREICTVEGIHPNDLGFYRIAEGIYKLYQKLGL